MTDGPTVPPQPHRWVAPYLRLLGALWVLPVALYLVLAVIVEAQTQDRTCADSFLRGCRIGATEWALFLAALLVWLGALAGVGVAVRLAVDGLARRRARRRQRRPG